MLMKNGAPTDLQRSPEWHHSWNVNSRAAEDLRSSGEDPTLMLHKENSELRHKKVFEFPAEMELASPDANVDGRAEYFTRLAGLGNRVKLAMWRAGEEFPV